MLNVIKVRSCFMFVFHVACRLSYYHVSLDPTGLQKWKTFLVYICATRKILVWTFVRLNYLFHEVRVMSIPVCN